MIVIVDPPASVTFDTVMVWLATDTVPVLAVVYPAAVAVVDGALHRLGAAIVIAPFCIPPDAAVYVKVIVRPLCEAETFEIELEMVPAPSTERNWVTLAPSPA